MFIFVNRSKQRKIVRTKKKDFAFPLFFCLSFLALQLQLTIIKENQMKIRKIVHLLQSCTNKKNIFVIQKSKTTKTK
jgi:hypothetical protein